MIYMGSMENWVSLAITAVVAIFGSGGLWAILQKQSDKKDIKRKMLLGLAHDRLVFLALKYIDKESVTKEEFENIHKYLFLPYKELGGNGTVVRLMEEVEKLPIRNSIYSSPMEGKGNVSKNL